MLSIKERAYLSGAQIFDNKVANTIYLKYYKLFNPYGWIDLYYNTFSLKDLFIQKREQYPNGDGQRTIYLENNWEYYLEFEPNFVHNKNDTTKILEKYLQQDFTSNYLSQIAKKLNVDYDSKELLKVIPYLEETTYERGKIAITKHLYSNVLKKISVVDKINRLLALNISERYTQTYLNYEGGTIITGLSCHLDYYDNLTETFPYYDLRIWRRIYFLMGCGKYIYTLCDNDICEIRNDIRYIMFIDIVRKMINKFVKQYDNQKRENTILFIKENENSKINFIIQNISYYFEAFRDEITSVYQFLDILKKNCSKIQKELLEQRELTGGCIMSTIDSRNIFVIYGRNLQAKNDLFDLLRSVDLKPFEWSTVVELTGEGCPTNYQSIDKAMDNVQAFIALFTDDDEVKLRDELLNKGEKIEDISYQPRPNVLFETGLAFGKDRKKPLLLKWEK